jgi:hypothetical protein
MRNLSLAPSAPHLALLACLTGTPGQMTPVGTWHTIDDKTNELKSEIQITEPAACDAARSPSCCARVPSRNANCTNAPTTARASPSWHGNHPRRQEG